MRRLIFAGLVMAIGCGALPDETLDDGDEQHDDVDAPGEEPTTVVDEPEQNPQPDACIDLDRCVDDGEAPLTAAAGDPAIIVKYAPLRKQPSADAPVFTGIEPGDGVHNDKHPYGNPLGVIPPGQRVKIESGPTDGFYKVSYDSRIGWVHQNKVEPLDLSLGPIKRAMKPAIWDAYFKHQIRRGKLNKDGPLRSGNCGPTSVAMARLIFGKEPKGLSVEQSIHAVRSVCCPGTGDRDGTTTSQMAHNMDELGLRVASFPNESISNDAKLERIDNQLAKGRVFMVRGRPGPMYREAMTKAFIDGGITGYHRFYTFGDDADERHWTLVVGKRSDGKYVVADPISEVGFVVITRAELRAFFNLAGGGGNAYWAD